MIMPSSRSLWRVSLALAAVLLWAGRPAASRAAQQNEASHPKLEAFSAEAEARKISTSLLDLETAREGAQPDESSELSTDGVLVNVLVERLDEDVMKRIEVPGVRVRRAHPRYKRVSIVVSDVAALREVAKVPEVLHIWPEHGAATRVGAATSRAPLALRSAIARNHFGLDGAGQKVGIVSDSFARTAGVRSASTTPALGIAGTLRSSKPQDSGDLPPAVEILRDDLGGAIDEGAAMAELVYDIAPGAAIAFHTRGRTEADMADGITRLCTEARSTVVVDDVFFNAEPMYQDGIIAQAAARCVAAGVPYFSAAGNDENLGFRQNFLDRNAVDDTSLPPSGNDLHDWGGGDGFLDVTLSAGGTVTVILQWNQPFESVSPQAGAQIDLDLYATRTPNAAGFLNPIARSFQIQGDTGAPDGDAVEIVEITNGDATPVTFFIAVEHYAGSQSVIPQDGMTPLEVRVIFVRRGDTDITVQGIQNGGSTFGGPTIWGHPMAPGAVSVGAVPWYDTEAFDPTLRGTELTDPEPFSSRGGALTVLFDGSGNVAPRTSFEPDIAAVDANNTTFFGSDLGFLQAFGEPDGFPNFPGTSAAAPNAAAVAALLLELDRSLTPEEIQDAFEQSAFDVMGSRAAVGKDDVTGAGLIDADAAIELVAGGKPRVTDPVPGTTLQGSTVSFTWSSGGAPVTEWWLYAGRSAGASDLYDSRSLGAALSATVAGLPTDGSKVWIRLFFRLFDNWRHRDFEFTAGAPSLPAIATPSPGSTLAGASATFSWSANGASILEWWLYVGTTLGGAELHDSKSLGAQLSTTVSGLPTDGRQIFVRLWFRDASAWRFLDVQYQACSGSCGSGGGATPIVTSPAPGSTLAGASATFSWSANGASILEWWLYVGTTLGGVELYNSNSLGTQLSTTVSGLPTDGRQLFVRLWFRDASAWRFVDVQYQACSGSCGSGGATPALTSPAPGSTLTGASATFSWSANGASVLEWWLYVGTTLGGAELYNSNSLGTQLSTTVSGIPTDGRQLFVRLWFRKASGWDSLDAQYLACSGSCGAGSPPAMTSPIPGSKLGGTTVTFEWSDNGTSVAEWWLYIGSSRGGSDIYYSGSLGTALATTVAGLPSDGRQLHARLWFFASGAWQFEDYLYVAAGGAGTPSLTKPINGSTLAGTTVSFEWTANGLPVLEWWLYVGSGVGGNDLHDSNSLGTKLSTTVSGLPSDGRQLFVRLWFRTAAAGWDSEDFVFVASGSGTSGSITLQQLFGFWWQPVSRTCDFGICTESAYLYTLSPNQCAGGVCGGHRQSWINTGSGWRPVQVLGFPFSYRVNGNTLRLDFLQSGRVELYTVYQFNTNEQVLIMTSTDFPNGTYWAKCGSRFYPPFAASLCQ
jgi:hypothetical protein